MEEDKSFGTEKNMLGIQIIKEAFAILSSTTKNIIQLDPYFIQNKYPNND